MAVNSADAERSLLEGESTGYGATGPAATAAPGESGAPGAGAAAPGAAAPGAAPPALSPEQILAEISRNAGVYGKMLTNALMGGLAPLLTEAMGTFVLVFTVGCTVASPTPSPWAPVAIATVLTVMVYATYNVSGAQLNPAVTFALLLLGKKSFTGMLGIWIFQFGGAFLALMAYKLVCAPHVVILAPVAPFHVGYSLGAEALYTALLIFVVLNCAARPRKEPNQCFGLAIGFAFLSSAYACGHVSGAALNPAVAVPLGLGGKDTRWAFCWFGAELVGAAVAVGLYWLLRRSELQVAAEVATATAAAAPGAAPAVEGDTGAAALGTVEGPSELMKCLAEAVGTFMLMLTVGMNIVSGSRATAYSAAAMVMCMIYAVGDISGGHFNPAVTLAVVLGGRGKITKKLAAKYLLAQLAAGAVAGLVVAFYHMGSAISEKSIKLVPGHGYSVFQAGFGELMATMVLSYTVLTVATVEGYVKDVTGLVVAYALVAGSFAVGSVSGGEVNPSVVLGLVLSNLMHPGKGGTGPVASWTALLVCEFVGAAVAASIFRTTHRKEFMPKEAKKEEVKGLQDRPADVEAQS